MTRDNTNISVDCLCYIQLTPHISNHGIRWVLTVHSIARISSGLATTSQGVSPTMTHDPGRNLSAGSLLHISIGMGTVVKLIVRAILPTEAHRDNVTMAHGPGCTLTTKPLPRVSEGRVLATHATRSTATYRAGCDMAHVSWCVLATVRHVCEAMWTKPAVLSQKIPTNILWPFTREIALALL